MVLQQFLRLTVYVDGVTQLLLKDVTVDGDLQLQDVETMTGLVGFTPGAKRINISCTSAVRQSGPEFDPIADGGEDSIIIRELLIPYGAKTIVTEGVVKTWSLSNGVNQSTDLGFQFTGTYQKVK